MNAPKNFILFYNDIESIRSEISNLTHLLSNSQRKDLQNELKVLNQTIEHEREKERTIDHLAYLKNLLTRRQTVLQELQQYKTPLARKAQLSKELELFSQVEEYIQKNQTTISKLEPIIHNFYVMNSYCLSNRPSLQSFALYICDKTGITEQTLLPWERESISGCTIEFKYQLDLLFNTVFNMALCSEQIFWLICYYQIYFAATQQMAKSWITQYPQFETIISKSAAIKAYIDLNCISVPQNKFQFSCWLFYSNTNEQHIENIFKEIDHDIDMIQRDIEVSHFKEILFQNKGMTVDQVPSFITDNMYVTIKIIDQYSGIEFEKFIGELFHEDGYQVEYTPISNDKGIDIIAKRNGISIGIQCKRYSSSVGISSVQEAYSGKNFYHTDKALVITNNYFTAAAKDLAKSTSVILWDRDILISKISLL